VLKSNPFPTAQGGYPAAARAETGGTAQTYLLRKLGWQGALWLALAIVSGWLLLNQGIPIAFKKPLLTVAIAATTGVVGLAIAQLGAVRFVVLGGRFDLFAGLAFGTLAVTNLGLGLLRPIAELSQLTPQVSMYTLLFGQAVAAVLFLVGLASARQVIPDGARRVFAWRRGVIVLVALVVGASVLLMVGDRLPNLLDPRTSDLLLDTTPCSRRSLARRYRC